jgi:hypothetical protein
MFLEFDKFDTLQYSVSGQLYCITLDEICNKSLIFLEGFQHRVLRKTAVLPQQVVC